MTGNILIAALVDQYAEVSLQHTSMLLKLQQELARAPDVSVSFEFFLSRADAFTFFKKNIQFDTIVVIGGAVSVNVDFLLGKAPYDLVVAAYPLCCINWERVEKCLLRDGEDVDKVGIKYNFTVKDDTPTLCTHGTYMPVDSAQLKLFKLTRSGFDTLTHDALNASDDDSFCSAWPGKIYVDLSTKCTNSGPYDFAGCIGDRASIR